MSAEDVHVYPPSRLFTQGLNYFSPSEQRILIWILQQTHWKNRSALALGSGTHLLGKHCANVYLTSLRYNGGTWSCWAAFHENSVVRVRLLYAVHFILLFTLHIFRHLVGILQLSKYERCYLSRRRWSYKSSFYRSMRVMAEALINRPSRTGRYGVSKIFNEQAKFWKTNNLPTNYFWPH